MPKTVHDDTAHGVNAEALGPGVLQISTELPAGAPLAEEVAVAELAAPLLAGLEALADVIGAKILGLQPPSAAPSGAQSVWKTRAG